MKAPPRHLTTAELELAACRQRPDVEFFPSSGQTRETAAAVAVCRSCPVQAPCLDTALARPEADDHGILGGTTRRERLRIRDERRAARRRAER